MTGRGVDVAVVGGGVIGLATAWKLAAAGLTVRVFDPQPGQGASNVAAGLLAPITEAAYGEERLLALNLASSRRWPQFSQELTAAAGSPSGYHQSGSLAVAVDADDRRALDELHHYHRDLGLESEPLTNEACRSLEPALAPGIRAGLRVDVDHQVDNRRFTAALEEAAVGAGVTIAREPASALEVEDGRVTGVRSPTGATHAGVTLLTAGAWSGTIDGLPEEVRPPVRPVKGQVLRLLARDGEPILTRNLRGQVHGTHLYVVPRPDGRVVVGATQEERGFDVAVTADAVHDLLRDAVELVPGLAEMELTEMIAGLRPGTPDNAPIIGRTSLDGLVVATGHFRNGLLLTPVTVDAVLGLLGVTAAVGEIDGFGPERFVSTAESAP